MDPALIPEERVTLLQFALRNFPRPIATSAVLGVARDRGIDDALLSAAAGEHAAGWRDTLPVDAPDATELARLGWEAPVHDPDVIASLVLLRPMPITIAAVNGLRAATTLSGHPIEERVARRANASLAEMADRVHRFATEPHDRRVIERWDPVALEALLRPNPSYYDEGLLRSCCAWLVAAIGTSMHEGWEEAAIKAADSMITRNYAHPPTAPGLDAALARLIERVPLGVARYWLGSQAAEVRQAALKRVRQVSPDRRGDAAKSLEFWAGDLRSATPWRFAGRGALGIFTHSCSNQDQTVPESLEKLEWLREAGEEKLVSVALQLVASGHPYWRVRALIEPEHTGAFEQAVIARFESEVSTSSRVDLAYCLADLGTAGAARALARGLSRDAVAEASERALSWRGSEVIDSELIAVTAAPDAAVALRAMRALAARPTPAAQPRLEELALTGAGPLRWVAVEALGRLGRQSRLCGVLRKAFGRATPHEEQLILDVLARCAETPADVAWTLDLPVRAGQEEALVHCTALVVAAWLASGAAPPPALLDRLAQLVRGTRHYRLAWSLDDAQRRAIAGAVEAHLHTRDPALAKMLADRIRWQLQRSAGGYNVVAGAAGAAEATPVAQQGRLAETACFSVIAPECVAPSESFILEVFVHSKAARDALKEWSSIAAGRRFTAGPRLLASGCTLDVTVSIEGIPLTQSTGQVLWDGDLGMAQFPCTVPADATSPTYPGKASFSLDGLKLAESHFLITVGPVVGVKREVAPTQQMIRSAFASYASGDRPAVLARIQGMQKAAPFIDIFLDVVSLRSGDDWAARIRSEIKARDVLLLFWSQAASQSRYVDTEWRMALEENGIERISPVPLEGPAVAPPPPELGSLHFNDWTLVVR